MVKRFLAAYEAGARDFHNAFTGPDGTRADGTDADAVLAIIAKYSGQAPEQVKLGITYIDASARLDVADVLHQIAWYKSQGMLKPEIDGAAIIDRRYVVPLE
jgi:hypothetical protein